MIRTVVRYLAPVIILVLAVALTAIEPFGFNPSYCVAQTVGYEPAR